ncbi:hypothetical protein S58_02520 [Bradyrhizobium oligotrophicum S58]|uniref:Uncharacterized protein n=1 Tax=Bradyrhizobium oligotrophicum S58 TaxID=1245469 RepID=M4Z136_9BRAD|nr:hypothetical protein S58_02520 [Bradyrhizobium oligotrophicum S58]
MPAEFQAQARSYRPGASARRGVAIRPADRLAVGRRHPADRPEADPQPAAGSAPVQAAAKEPRRAAVNAVASPQPEAAAAVQAVGPALRSVGEEAAWGRRPAAPAASDVQALPPAAARAESPGALARAGPRAEAAAAYAPEERPPEAEAVWDAAVPEARRVAAAPDAAAQPAAEAGAVEAAEQDVGPRPAAEVGAAPGAAQQPAEAPAEPDGEARRLEPDAAAGLAAAASVDRLGRLHHLARQGPGLRPSARSARVIRCSPIASPTARSSQAAGREVCSFVLVSRNVLFQARCDQQVCVRPDCGAVQIRKGIYFDAKQSSLRRHSCFIQP